MINVGVLYRVNPQKFIDLAKSKTYKEFIKYLEEQPNFKIIYKMTENEKKELYQMAKLGL